MNEYLASRSRQYSLKMQKGRILIVLLVALMALGSVNTTEAGVAEATAIFLNIAPGARSGGMGEAFVAIADDATATWWNPAGLAFIEDQEFTFMHVDWLPQFRLDDLYYDFSAYVRNIEDWGTVGFSVIYLNLGETQRTDELNNKLGMFRTFESAVTGSFGTTIMDNMSMGINLKFVYSHLADRGAGQEEGSGVGTNFAVDLGLLYFAREPLLDKNVALGMNLSNMGPKMAYIDHAQADPMPTNLKFGIAWHLIDDAYNRLILAYDMNKLLVSKDANGETDPFYIALFTSWADEPFFLDLIYNVGLEYWYTDMVALRVGYWNDQLGHVKPITYGASFKVSAYRFDFSYTNAGTGHPLTDTMRFSLSIEM